MADNTDKVIIERSGSGALVAIIAVIVIALVAVGAYALIQNERKKDNAISEAASSVGDAAKDVGDAAKDAAKKVD